MATAAATTVTTAALQATPFPDLIQYPIAVQHFLLIETLGFFVCSIFFLFLFVRNVAGSNATRTASLAVFFTTAVATFATYAMWTGIGVYLKQDSPPRLIFWGRYIDHIVAFPLILLAMGLIAKANTSTLVSLVGNGILMVAVQFIGALVLAPYKYIWWTAGVAFLGIVIIQLVVLLSDAQRLLSPAGCDALKVLVLITAISWTVYPIVWVLGSEGLAVMHLTVEVGVLTLVDWISKLAFGGFLLMQRDAFEDIDTIGETTKLRPTSELV